MFEQILEIVKRMGIEECYHIQVVQNDPVLSIGDDVSIIEDESLLVVNHKDNEGVKADSPLIALAVAVQQVQLLRLRTFGYKRTQVKC